MAFPNAFQINAFQDNAFQVGAGVIPTSLGTFRFLKDHVVSGDYILAGSVRQMMSPWVPTGDVEPLDSISLASFYAEGPQLGGVWRTMRSDIVIFPPTTYWYGVAPNLWGLSGLGSALPPIPDSIGRIKDKEP